MVSQWSEDSPSKAFIAVADCLALMQAGTELIKLRTNVRQFRRIFSLDADMVGNDWIELMLPLSILGLHPLDSDQ